MKGNIKKWSYPFIGLVLSGCATLVPKEMRDNVVHELSPPTLVETSGSERRPTISEEDSSSVKRPDVRFYSTNEILDGHTVSDNLIRVSYDGFAIGYERLDDGKGQSAGIQVPVGSLLRIQPGLDIYLLGFEDESGQQESEAIVRIKLLDKHEVDIIVRGFDLHQDDGFAIATNYRTHADFSSPDNLGGGLVVARSGEESDIGGYVWSRFGNLGGLVAGFGSYLQNNRIVIGVPNKAGFAWRYFRIDAQNGFELNEFLFSTQAQNLDTIDAWSALNPNKETESFSRPGVFRYIVPPPSGRGKGWTGGLIHRKFSNGQDSLDVETVRYFRNIFTGGHYGTDFNSNGTIGIPFGYQFDGGDGLTRNFIRAEPLYNRESGIGAYLTFERKF